MKKTHLFFLIASIYSSSNYAGFEVVDSGVSKVDASANKISINKTDGSSIEIAAEKSIQTLDKTLQKPKEPIQKQTINNQPKSKLNEIAIVSGLGHSGKKPEKINPVKGFGRDVKFKDALTQIVPSNFEVINTNNINLDGNISWSGLKEQPWTTTLDAAMRQAGVSGVIDWDSKVISLGKSLNTQSSIEASKPVWKLKTTDKSLRQAIIRWSKEAGYHIDWDVNVDFPIQYETDFKGNFEEAITSVMDSLVGTDYPLQACSYENKTIRIVRFGETGKCTTRK